MYALAKSWAANTQALQLAFVILVVLLGLAAALGFNAHGLEHSVGYVAVAFGLLCFGLYMAAYGIDLKEVRAQWRIVASALTIGVLAKFIIIAAITVAVTHDWRYVALSMAVAQIDPLAVSALNDDGRMSARAKTILNIWASLDDPITAIFTPVVQAVTITAAHLTAVRGMGLADSLISLAPFALLAPAFTYVVITRRMTAEQLPMLAWTQELRDELHQYEKEGPKTAVVQSVITGAVALRSGALAALAGLAFRPAWLSGRVGALLTKLALAGAAFLLGMLLASSGPNWSGGLLLGAAVYVSHIVSTWGIVGFNRLLPGGKHDHLTNREIWHLALAQQNGITAIVLSLVLQITISSAVPTIAPMIVVVALLQFAANWLFDRFFDHA